MLASPPRSVPLQPLLTEIRVAAPSGWKLQETDAALLITSTDVNVHGSFASVPFSTNISSGVLTSTADTWTAWQRQREERRTRHISAALRMRKFTLHCLEGQKRRGISNSCIGWLHRHCIIPPVKQYRTGQVQSLLLPCIICDRMFSTHRCFLYSTLWKSILWCKGWV